MTRDKSSYAWGGLPKWPMAALALVTLVDAVDVSILRGVLPLIKEDWDLSDFQLGLLGFAFIFVHSIASIPAGWMADRYRRTRIIGFTMLTWSAVSVIAAASVNYLNLLGARALLGLGQSVDDPPSTALLADYYPSRLRGRVFSVQQVMQFVGLGAGLGLAGAVGSALGWRWAFVLVGTPGLLVAFIVFRLREPLRGEADHVEAFGTPPSPEEQRKAVTTEGIGSFLSHAAKEIVREVRVIFGIRTMRYILVGISVLLFTVSGIGYWLAIYHQRYSGLSLVQSTAATAIVLASGGIVGTLWGGRLFDRAYGSGPAGRISLIGTTIVVSLVFFIASFNVPYVPARFVLQALGAFVGASAVPGLRASMTDVVPAESRGMGVSALSLTSALFGQALAPPVVGLLSDRFSLLAAFNIVSPVVLLGALIVLRARHTIVADAQAIFAAMVPAAVSDAAGITHTTDAPPQPSEPQPRPQRSEAQPPTEPEDEQLEEASPS